MLTRFLRFKQRRWGYATLEVLSVGLFSFCASSLFVEHQYQWGPYDRGMARATAICFMLLSLSVFIMANCLKKIDYKKLESDRTEPPDPC